MLKLAITGNIAAGKSEVCKIFADNGAYVVYSDKIVHQLLNPDTKLGRKIIELLGNEIVTEGKINRAKIAEKVFASLSLLNALEKLLHPFVYKEIEQHFNTAKQKSPSPLLFVAEIPLLFETGSLEDFDKIVVVTANEESCKKRFLKHKRKPDDFDRRQARFLDEKQKIERADIVIENKGTLEELRSRTDKLFNTLCEHEAKKLKRN